MDSKPLVKLSVQNLIEYALQSGDIGSDYCSTSRAAEGIKGHKAIQRSYISGYTAEVPVVYTVKGGTIDLEINGRIDGILVSEEEITIEEIKTTVLPLDTLERDYNPLHWAQAKCYAFIYASQNSLDTISIQLTYYNIASGKTKFFLEYCNIGELEEFFFGLTSDYMEWAEALYNWTELRNSSISRLQFPFESYRKGQRELAAAIYRTIGENGRLFAQAPTGTGKTIASLYPSVKAMGEGKASKIFYLTAKASTRGIAEKAVEIMRQQGLHLKALTITAKEKICFNCGTGCDPQLCEYARGYYDRVKSAIKDVFKLESLTRDIVEEYARKHRICPFEFSLDLSLSSDCIICDYNYAFDPRVYLKRFFMNRTGDYIFLIDEAHNLADRAREMFSAELLKKTFLDLRKAVRTELPDLSKLLQRINSAMVSLRKLCEEDDLNYHVQKDPPRDLITLLREFATSADSLLMSGEYYPFREALADLYFQVQTFLKTAEVYDERFTTYFEKTREDFMVKLFCLDPSFLLKEALKRAAAAIFFSATLTPLDYFIKILGGDEDSYHLRLPSPFPRENLCLLLDDRTSTKYRNRPLTYDHIARSIACTAAGKTGNYLVYFPSYSYMHEVYSRFQPQNPDVKVILQREGISDSERDEFLSNFENTGSCTLIGFAVMGGIFGEGIDLTGDRLSGAVIVGVGLPQLCLERDIIRRYFDETKEAGFEYAYVYPGMNKVLQAVGRVIRTSSDRGVVLLIDDRFSSSLYESLYPAEWHPVTRVRDLSSLKKEISSFWAGN